MPQPPRNMTAPIDDRFAITSGAVGVYRHYPSPSSHDAGVTPLAWVAWTRGVSIRSRRLMWSIANDHYSRRKRRSRKRAYGGNDNKCGSMLMRGVLHHETRRRRVARARIWSCWSGVCMTLPRYVLLASCVCVQC